MTKKTKNRFYPAAMTIAGSDSGGGAGIAADLRTFNAFGVFGTCAITAVTSQNPYAVRRIDPLDADSVYCQISTVLEKIPVKNCKTGMLFSSENIAATAKAVREFDLNVVCDPVMVSTSKSKLLCDDAIDAMKEILLPLANWITPNIPEAELLTGRKISSVTDMRDAAVYIAETYSANILLKGGHLCGKSATDVIVRAGKCYTLDAPVLQLPPLTSHGTGCTLSAALTAMLALDLPWKQAVCEAKAFVYGSLDQAVNIAPELSAMYPPSEDSIQLIKLNEMA